MSSILTKTFRRARAALVSVALLAATGILATSATPAAAAGLNVSSKQPWSSNLPPIGAAAAPSTASYVSTTGSDSNPGTAAAPYRTLANALSKVKAGGAIVMRGGVYREGAGGYATGGTKYYSRLSGVTIQAAVGETVWLDGTEVVANWTAAASGRWSTSWSTPTLCAGEYYNTPYASSTSQCNTPDAIRGQTTLGDPQMLFRDGVELKEVASLAQVTADTFYYDWAAKTMHIGFNPAGRTVEITKQAQALAFYQPTNLNLRNIGIRRFASNSRGNATGAALLLNGGTNVNLDGVVVRNNAGAGILSWATRNLKLSRTIVSYNGANGMNFAGSQPKLATDPSVRDDVVIEYSLIERNNADAFSVQCQTGCSAAGVKMVEAVGVTVRYSSINNNGGGQASGWWCDLNCVDAKVYGNRFVGNALHAIIYEASDKAIIASNIISVNGWGSNMYGGGYALMIGSPNVSIWNNTITNNKMGVFLYDDPRSPGSNIGVDASRVGPNTVNIDFVNNIVTTNTTSSRQLMLVTGGSSTVAGNTPGAQVVREIDYNSYAQPASNQFFIWRMWSDKAVNVYSNIAGVQAAWGATRDAHGQLLTTAVNPYLTNPDKDDYTLKAGGAAQAGKPLPANVASMLGLSAGASVPRGAFTQG